MTDNPPWRERLEPEPEPYPYPEAGDAVRAMWIKRIPEEMRDAFVGYRFPSARFFGELLPHLSGCLQEQIEQGTLDVAPFRTTLVGDADILLSALDKLSVNRPLETFELEMLAVEPDPEVKPTPENPTPQRLRHDVVGEIKAYFYEYRMIADHPVDDYGIDDSATEIEEQARADEQRVVVLAELQADVTGIGVILDRERGRNQGHSSPS